jgi:hypothetical protein
MPAKKNMDPIMVDLETLGTSPNSVILSIGAVKFDPDTRSISDRFYVVIDKNSCLLNGLTVDPETQKWWDGQKDEAKVVLRQAEGVDTFTTLDGHIRAAVSLDEALDEFGEFAHWNSCVWGNGSDFDNAMLQEAYKKIGRKQPWAYWNNRCYRTMKNMIKDVKFERVGTYHNAVDDAETQAFHLMDILAKLRG